MKDEFKKAFEGIDASRSEILDLYKEFINRESYSGDLPAVKRFSDFLKSEMEKEGFECKYIGVGHNADTLVGILGKDRPGKPILFCGHMDTVFQTGLFGKDPFHIEDGKAYGPGVLDMKGGILIALYTVKTLNRMGYNERPIKFCFSGDEEIMHRLSQGAEVIKEEAKGCLCAFNMETGLIDNYLCTGRKGCLRYNVSVEGVETHSGNDFQGGRSAIVEMAHKIIDLHNITDINAGTTVNVATIKGGTVPNAVPAHCEVVLDMRYKSLAEKEKMLEKFKKAYTTTHIEGTATDSSLLSSIDVFETTSEGLRFFNFVKNISKEYNLGEINGRTLGGCSDAASTTMAGVPTICSCGVRGQWNHTKREYAVVDSIFERIKLYTTAVVNMDSFDKESIK